MYLKSQHFIKKRRTIGTSPGYLEIIEGGVYKHRPIFEAELASDNAIQKSYEFPESQGGKNTRKKPVRSGTTAPFLTSLYSLATDLVYLENKSIAIRLQIYCG
jgi:hypothetical protein